MESNLNELCILNKSSTKGGSTDSGIMYGAIIKRIRL